MSNWKPGWSRHDVTLRPHWSIRQIWHGVASGSSRKLRKPHFRPSPEVTVSRRGKLVNGLSRSSMADTRDRGLPDLFKFPYSPYMFATPAGAPWPGMAVTLRWSAQSPRARCGAATGPLRHPGVGRHQRPRAKALI